MYLKFVDILNSISLFQLILFILFLIDRKKNKDSNIFLIVFFACQFLSISNHFINSQKDFFIQVSPHLFYWGLAFPFLWAPFLYFYIKSLLYSDFRFKTKHSIHFLPFIIYFLYIVVEFHIQGTGEKLKIINENLLRTYNSVLISNVLITVQITVYFVFLFRMYHGYKTKFKHERSNLNPGFISWVNLIIYGFFVAFLLVNVCRMALYSFPNYKDLFVFISFFVFFVYFILLFYNAIGHPELFQKIEEKNEIKSHIIPENEAQQLLNELHDYMQQKEPYLNPDLSLKQLAGELGTNERLLSGVINQYKKQNFYDFINNYRVSKAKRLLVEEKHKKRTVQEIFYDSGFNSKSTFNFAFKKYIGITPTEFKKQYTQT